MELAALALLLFMVVAFVVITWWMQIKFSAKEIRLGAVAVRALQCGHESARIGCHVKRVFVLGLDHTSARGRTQV